MNVPWPADAEFLTPAEVQAAFRVHPLTVRQWANTGLLSSVRTPGGHRRYHRAEVEALLNGPRVVGRGMS